MATLLCEEDESQPAEVWCAECCAHLCAACAARLHARAGCSGHWPVPVDTAVEGAAMEVDHGASPAAASRKRPASPLV